MYLVGSFKKFFGDSCNKKCGLRDWPIRWNGLKLTYLEKI
jgi:hypothetical protein